MLILAAFIFWSFVNHYGLVLPSAAVYSAVYSYRNYRSMHGIKNKTKEII